MILLFIRCITSYFFVHLFIFFFFFSSRRRHTRWTGDWSSDVCSSDLPGKMRASPGRVCPATATATADGPSRSEERRVGKECSTRWLSVHSKEGEPQLYEVPAGKHLRVHEGARLRAGDRLTEGPVTANDSNSISVTSDLI